MFDGSSIAGWKAINKSDMALIPDAATAVMDPFAAQSALILFCDVAEPSTGEPYMRDPRSIAKKAEAYVASTGVGDAIYFGPEAEFFVFDDVRYEVKMNTCFSSFRRTRGPMSPGASSRRATPATGRRSRAATSRFAGQLGDGPARRNGLDDAGNGPVHGQAPP